MILKIDKSIVREAAFKTAKEISGLTYEQRGHLVSDIFDIYHFPMDGFAICKKLDQMGWDINTKLVNEIDRMDSNLSAIIGRTKCEMCGTDKIVASNCPDGEMVEYCGRCDDPPFFSLTVNKKTNRRKPCLKK